ncbi:MAG TPA: hypothetical protein VLO07_02655 [Thermoanaerobaculia bacterium]|nr:hypothetical protein [Thermoanaerobaculia bacterium]
MRVLRILAMGVVALALAAGLTAGETKAAAGKSDPGFEKLKSLAGDWEGKADDGKSVKATYKVTSAGSAVAETLQTSGEPEMLTVYHMDDGHLMMTHYCSLANQPRMQAAMSSGDAQSLDFSYVGATNMASADADHMHHLVFRFEDTNHFSEQWTMKGKGHEMTVAFHLERKK